MTLVDHSVLRKEGITDSALRELAFKHIPCGIETAKEALQDKTLVQINAPRAIMVVHWKGYVNGHYMMYDNHYLCVAILKARKVAERRKP